MIKCISDETSKRFIRNVFSPMAGNACFFSTSFLPFYTSRRVIVRHARQIWDTWRHCAKEGGPLLVLLNLIHSGEDDKHAMALILLPGPHGVEVAHFDPNGALLASSIPDKNVLSLLEALADVAAEQQTPLSQTDLMARRAPINIVGSGHCDALSLMFLYRNMRHTTIDQIRRDLDEWCSSFSTPSLARAEVRRVNRFVAQKAAMTRSS